MTYDQYKARIAANVDRDDLTTLIASWINEAREEIALHYPFNFLMAEKTINVVASTFSYAFDAGGSTDRYSGMHYDVKYYDASTTKKLTYLEQKMFDRLYPNSEAGDPVAYTVRGDKFYLNAIPSTVTSKTFIARYFTLPDALSSGSDEKYMDKKYYNCVLAATTIKALLYINAINQVQPWVDLYKNELTKMIAQDTGVRITDVKLEDESSMAGGAGVSTGGSQ